MKPDYVGAERRRAWCPRCSGVRPVEWMPAPVAGARATVVLLVLDGLGWNALDAHPPTALPELRAFAGRPDHHRRAVDHRRRAHVDHHRAAAVAARHPRLPHPRRRSGVLNVAALAARRRRPAARPVHVQRHGAFLRPAGPGGHQGEFRTTGFTAAHLRGADFHGWQTHRRCSSSTCRRWSPAATPFVYAYYPGVDEVAHAFGLHDAFYPAELAAADRLVGDAARRAARDAALLVTADHGQVHLGPEAGRTLAPLHALVDDLRGRRSLPLPARAAGACRRAAAPRRERARRSGRVGVHARASCSTTGGWARTRCPRRYRRASATSCSRPEARSGSSTPRCPYEASLARAHGSLTAAEMRVPLVAGPGGRAR